MENAASRAPRPPKEIIFPGYGLYTVTGQEAYAYRPEDDSLLHPATVVVASAPTWRKTVGLLRDNRLGWATVLTPELITVADITASTALDTAYRTAEANLEEAVRLSEAQPYAQFVIGTPYWPEGSARPFNAAVTLQNGRIGTVALKRLLHSDELTFFDVQPEAAPAQLDNATLLVCRDLIGAEIATTYPDTDRLVKYVEVLTQDQALAERYRGARMLALSSQRLLVSACWGTGLVNLGERQALRDDHYLALLRLTAGRILAACANVQQIIVCDRAPLPDSQGGTSSRPISGVFFR